jgi:hypothetical protein
MASCGAVSMGTTDDRVQDAERHDPDQCRRSTAAQGIRAVSCSTRFLRWMLLGWVAAASCSVIGVYHQ